ncbi:MAG: cellulase family glycosylhydrolase, partial [Ruminococcus sp.]|nr:cellulase family glycosylhydrolase [Ruminococcus sp.]
PHGKREYSGNTCPASMAKWDNSTDKNNWKYSSEECAKSILKVNPHALILIEGIEQSPMIDRGYTWDDPDKFQPKEGEERWYGAWWGGNLRGVKDLPVLPESGQIVYSPHDYGPSVYAQTWFAKDFTTETLLKDYWYDTWAYINDKDIAPLLIGEWGGHMDKGPNQKWMELLRDYMINNHINHTFWCLNPNSGDTGGLLDTQFKNWDEAKYGLFEEALWQTSGGKYIGLDHKTALGENGLSLSQFYSSGEKSNLDGGKSSGIKPTQPTTEPTTKPTEPTTGSKVTLYGDSNCSGDVKMNDAVLVMQLLANGDAYDVGGTDKNAITETGRANADCYDPGSGITNMDAVAIQKKLINTAELPITIKN